MVDQSVLDGILEATRSELKRWGGDSPSLTHAAYVFARRYRAEFEEVFGAEGREDVESLLRQGRFRGDEAKLRELLAADDVPGAVRAVHAALADDLAELATAQAAPEAPGTPDAPATPAQSAAEETAPRVEGEAAPAAAAVEEPDALPERTARLVRVVEPAADQARHDEAAEVAAQLLRTQPTITAIVGERGVGRTSLLAAVADRLASSGVDMPVLRLAPETLVANPTSTLRMVLDDLSRPTVVVIDDLDDLARLGSDTPDRDLIALTESARTHPFARLAVILEKRHLSRLSILAQSLHDELAVVLLAELPPDVVSEIVQTAAMAMAGARGLELDPALLAAALAPGLPADGLRHPGLALSRLDQACARAVVARSATVKVEHLAPGGLKPALTTEAQNFADVLSSKVKGQSAAIASVSQRLTLTRANLDLRPERPNGVFLFVGPTGVGKTELAKEIAVHEYGGPDRLIRLDMSEFAQEWAISRLVGPMPGYVGSTEPESWLTTKVAAAPRSVILLDEIEKAHPRVWNTFLQVFDSGRLTDSRGVTADFSEAVVVMTSNLGVKEAGSRAVGFSGGDTANRERLLSVVRDQMAPELLNRMDEVIVFNALSMDAIIEIAKQELANVHTRLSASGWSVDYDHGVAEWLAKTGYDPTYGARHLQRNIEREFLTLLAGAPSRNVSVSVDGAELRVRPS